ncbi:MAG TPA: ABC transporter permease [Acidimicrobiales bacterium]|nr:ABC transporter permease [Acidimicrobiales bacterium]
MTAATLAATAGLGALYRRRLAVTTKTLSGIVGQIATPILWILVVAPALDTALGGFDPSIDYYTYVAVGQVAFLVPFTAMFNGLNVIVDKDYGITRELVVAPIARGAITIANALGVLTIALVQVALIVGLAVARGAEFHTSPSGVVWFLAAAALLTLTIYGVAEILALRIGRQEAYGPLIPAVGVTPWFLSGALFPITVLPAGIEQFALVSPWTHAVAVMRHGMMQGDDSGLEAIWYLGSETAMAALSVTVLALFATLTLSLAVRAFQRATTA